MRLAGLVGTVPVTRLIVMSPYWDANLDGLLGLIDAMRPQEIIIALSAHRPQFPLDGLPLIPDARFASIFDGNDRARFIHAKALRSEEHTSELQSLMRISYAVFCLKKKNNKIESPKTTT